jgi:hypothetical protein
VEGSDRVFCKINLPLVTHPGGQRLSEVSIDGTKFSGRKLCDIAIPDGLFEREEFVTVGRSMLKRFQMDGRTLEDHEVRDRLLLTF